jgi:hypothetical protein
MKKINWFLIALSVTLLILSTFIGTNLIIYRDVVTDNFADLLFLSLLVAIGVICSITLLIIEIKTSITV